MPRYDYGCGVHGIFEDFGGVHDSSRPCPICHEPARRRPFSGVPNLKGETVARSQIPDPVYKQDAEARHLNKTWGDESRSIEMLRKNVIEDRVTGKKSINLKGMNDGSA